MRPRRNIFIIAVISWCSLTSLYGQDLLEGHTDIMFIYNDSTGQWSGNFVDGDDFENPDKDVPFDQASLPLIDQLYDSNTGLGDREIALSGDEFIGISAGDPFWLLPQNQGQVRDYTWPGFRSQVSPNTFRSYQPSDSRINSSQRWITHTLTDVTYAGQSSTAGQFSAFQYDLFGSPIIWMASSDGIDSTDVFYLDENGHAHTNFGFSELGIYRVGLQASAILDSDGSTVTASEQLANSSGT
ncbi:MAG: choice-of-anchor M domain-containing protein [Verrucomicrobiota bacterium]